MSDDFHERDEIIDLSDAAFRAHIQAMVWCNRLLTDGCLHRARLRRAVTVADPEAAAAELVGAGTWTETESGWQLDWSDQETAEKVKARRARNAKKQHDYRDRHERHAADDHSMCDPRFCKSRKGSPVGADDDPSNASPNWLPNWSRNQGSNHAPTRPVPSRPEGTGTGTPAEDAAEQARRDPGHIWEDDGSGESCVHCGFPPKNARHQTAASP
jgi:hypothetical protein